MKEFVASTIERRLPPMRDAAVNEYLLRTHADARDHEALQHIRDQIAIPARPIAPYIVCIPVAAHQESAQISKALQQYAEQQTDTPFTVVLGLNSPLGFQGDHRVADTLSEVEQAKHRYPHVDIRSAFTYYDAPTIGMIRRDIWNAVLQLSVDEGAYSQQGCAEVIGMNHDIDTEYMSPHYIARVQNHYRDKQARYARSGIGTVIMPPATSVTRHAMDEAHYYSSLGAKWMDYATQSVNGWYEAGSIIPLSHYADRGGFYTNATTYETGVLMKDTHGHRIPGTLLRTSPRRYVERLDSNGFDTIWTPDSFGPMDECREDGVRYDISASRLQFLMKSSSCLRDYLLSSNQRAIVKRHNELTESSIELTRDEWGVEMVGTVMNHTAKVAYVALRGFGLYEWASHIYALSTDEAFFCDVMGIDKKGE